MNGQMGIRTAAITAMAVMLVGVSLIGCVTKRDIEEVKSQLVTVERGNRETQQLVARMDSIIAAGAEADNKLRNDLRVSSRNIEQQISQLLENYNDLMQRIDELSREKVIKLPPRSSPGAQNGPASSITPAEPQSQTPSFDCIRAYDEAFILVRKSEYEKAIERFRVFLEKCGQHENADAAYYWIGECYYSMEQYQQAITEFDYLLKSFQGSAKVAPALYKLARSKQELGRTDEARGLFQQIVEEHPGTLEAEQAKERLKDLK